MKIILAATDFSEAALNAVHYAVEFSLITRSKVVLFHAFQTPLAASDATMNIPPLRDMEEDVMKELTNMATALFQKYGNRLDLICKITNGLAVAGIDEMAKKEGADLVVMGVHGAGGLMEKLAGSVTTSVISKATYPVMAVHEKVIFRTPGKIVLATDFAGIAHPSILEPLKTIGRMFKSHICILNVVPEAKAPRLDEAVSGIRLEHMLEDLDHSYHVEENEDVVQGINDFVSRHGIDLVVMIPRAHSYLRQIFVSGNTKRLAFHAKAPLLALHE